MEDKINQFIKQIAQKNIFPCTYNMYTDPSSYASQNLDIYLHQMANICPEVLLVGEAPGYNGCKLTGVPFTSEYILRTNPFFRGKGYRTYGYQKENTATIIWEQIGRVRIPPLMWNYFPLHPYENGNPESNRPPQKEEKEWGITVILHMMRTFPSIDTIVAIGNHAGASIRVLELPFKQLRHPSHGGKTEFIHGFETVFNLRMG